MTSRIQSFLPSHRPLNLLLLAGCLVLLGLFTAMQWQARRQALGEAERHTANLASSIRAHAEQVLQRADDAATELVRLVEPMPAAASRSPVLQELMLHHTGSVSGVLHEISVFGTDGRLRFSSFDRQRGDALANDRDFFAHHHATARDTAFVGRPYRMAHDGRWVLPLSRRVAASDGGFGGVVVAAVDIDRLQDYLRGFDVGTSGSATLLTR